MATVSDLNKGSYIRYNGEVVQVEELQHRTPGNLRAFYQIKMRNLRNGKGLSVDSGRMPLEHHVTANHLREIN